MNHLIYTFVFWLIIVVCTALGVLSRPRRVPTLLSYAAVVVGAACLGHVLGVIEMVTRFHLPY
jgi:hypothetical protein